MRTLKFSRIEFPKSLSKEMVKQICIRTCCIVLMKLTIFFDRTF